MQWCAAWLKFVDSLDVLEDTNEIVLNAGEGLEISSVYVSFLRMT